MGGVDRSGGHGETGSPRAVFAARLAELWEAAGNPTLQRVADATEERMRAARAPGQVRGFSVQRISDWRTGRNVPSRFESFEPVLLTLIRLAQATSGPIPSVLSNRSAWQRLWQAANAEPSSHPVVTTALRRDIDTFVGRSAELHRILDAAGPGRVVSIHTIDGMPGVGKTALVTHAAHLLYDRFPDGRFFVELNAHTPGQTPADPFDVLARLLTDLGIAPGHIPGTLEARSDLWRDRLSHRRVLVVLDDARDHAQIEPLLPTGPECLVLITSRRRLVALDGAVPLVLNTLDPANAADLFCRVAQRIPSGSDTSAVADIVRSCGYLPLAIVLLAGRLAHHPTWTIPGLAAEFATTHDRLGKLDTGHRAVHAAFTTSYADLPPDRQHLFRRLALHPGPDLDAYAVAALNNIPLSAARRALDDLYTDHLIDETAPGRYRLHDLLREYARTLSADDPIDDRTRATDRLLDYYRHTGLTAVHPAGATPADSAPATMPDLSTHASALTWMQAERANLLACLKYAASTGKVSLVVDLTNALTGELRLHGAWQTAILFNKRAPTAGHVNDLSAGLVALGAAEYLADDYAVAADLLQHVLETRVGIGSPAARAFALRTLAWTRLLAGDYAMAADVLQQVLAIYREIGNRSGEASARNLLGCLAFLTGGYAAAIDLFQQALTTYRELGHQSGEAAVLNYLGGVQSMTGDYPAAADTLQQAATIYRGIGRRAEEAFALMLVAWVRYLTGEHQVAADLIQQVLTLYREIDNRSGEAYALNALGWMRHWTGGYPEAAELIQQALAIHQEIDNRSGEASALNNLGRVRYLTGDYAVAADLIGQARAIYDSIGNRVGEAEALANLGSVRYLTGDYQTAAGLMQQALTIYRDAGHRSGETDALNRMGALVAGSGDLRRALAIYDDALCLARRMQSPFEQARALHGSARCRIGLDDRIAAEVDLQEAVALYERTGAVETGSAARDLAALQQELNRC
ncbi:ATP-binding protein [Nocardia transvalensis]|uniref:ATP-binding protein n=1 Tax=Nocardia transvalensis TaxID=37333 RepID=UPI0018946EB3|nr:tetratricopeptide repeat protein [Nocardia transvalensis]MBF6332978.1 tetratricopeptide repeat protein [Nocardia transvalensis]